MSKVIISARAKQELEDIWLTIALENHTAADQILRRIGEQILLLNNFPEIGTLRKDIGFQARMLVHGNYLVLYEYTSDNDTVTVISVVDGRRDLTELF